MTQSNLVKYTKLSPNCTKPRNHKIDTISIHCVAGNASVETLGNIFAPSTRQASCQYGIGSDGRIGQYCLEENRSWCTSNAANDHRAITIEVANDGGAPDWHVSDKAIESLINLLVDICKRNNIPKLLWKGDKSLIGNIDKQNMTVHRWFANKACLPVEDTELLTKDGWVKLKDVEIGMEVASVNKKNLSISFTPVLDVIEPRIEEVYRLLDVEATKDHKMIFYNNNEKLGIMEFKNIFYNPDLYLPNAGYYKGAGLDLKNNEIELLILTQSLESYYMPDNSIGVEYDSKSDPKTSKIISLLNSCKFKYELYENVSESDFINIYDDRFISLYNEYFTGDSFNWKFLELNSKQVKFFLSKIFCWNENTKHIIRQNKDIISAIASINGIGILINNNNVILESDRRIILDSKLERAYQKIVSCVTVESGFILIRQDRRTTVVGNCPGDYLYSIHPKIAAEVNNRLNVVDVKPTDPIKTNNEIIWNFLKYRIGNEYGVAGLMGNIFAESALNPINLQNSFEKSLGFTDQSYTKAVDDGSYTNFVNDKAGYGLAQWTFWSRKENLLKYSKQYGSSIGDLNMQLNFLWNELQAGYSSVIKTLEEAKSVLEASNAVLLKFERPANQGLDVQAKRAEYGQKYYDMFVTNKIITPPKPIIPDPTPVFKEYKIRVTHESLNVRQGPGTNYKVVAVIKDKGVYTIIGESKGSGSTNGWAKLKSGIGYISLDYTKKI